jgi:tetratricopeptide (TPR) repeat protein
LVKEAARRWRVLEKNLPAVALAALAVVYAAGLATQQIYWASDLLLYGRAYQIAPRDKLIGNNLGNAVMDAGQYDKAIALYSQVLARDPKYWLANYNLGYAFYKIGRFKEAEVFLRRAIGVGTDADEFLYLGLSQWRQGRLDEAAQNVQRAIQIRPSAPGYHFALAMIRRDQNDIPAARAELSLELLYYPDSNAARQQLAALGAGAK